MDKPVSTVSTAQAAPKRAYESDSSSSETTEEAQPVAESPSEESDESYTPPSVHVDDNNDAPRKLSYRAKQDVKPDWMSGWLGSFDTEIPTKPVEKDIPKVDTYSGYKRKWSKPVNDKAAEKEAAITSFKAVNYEPKPYVEPAIDMERPKPAPRVRPSYRRRPKRGTRDPDAEKDQLKTRYVNTLNRTDGTHSHLSCLQRMLSKYRRIN
jgi:hypothetical protein